MIYLDNAATTKPTKEVIADITWCLENVWGNPSSIHTPGIEAKRLLEGSREKVAKFINADPDEIIFTASGSESNNLAIKGFLDANDMYECIITTKVEHPSVYNTCMSLIDDYAWYRVDFAPVDEAGRVKVNRFKQLISELSYSHYCFVSIMLANNEVGSINDIKKIANIVHHHSGILHVDATQAVGHISVDVKELDCDLLSFSGHKLNCPKGVGVLYKKKDIKLSPIVHGGHQEGEFRAGTENLPYIYALGNQVDRIGKVNPNYEIRDYLKRNIICDYMGIMNYNGNIYSNENYDNYFGTLPNILSLTFEGINAEALITLLDMRGVCVSAGSACSSGEKTPSRVLNSIGLTDEEAFSTVRISIGEDTTIEECDEFIRILGECLKSLKMMGGE